MVHSSSLAHSLRLQSTLGSQFKGSQSILDSQFKGTQSITVKALGRQEYKTPDYIAFVVRKQRGSGRRRERGSRSKSRTYLQDPIPQDHVAHIQAGSFLLSLSSPKTSS